MKREILKKTLLYRCFSFIIAMIISTLLVNFFLNDPLLSWYLTIWTEIGAVCLYYTFEYYWRRWITRRNIKKGISLFSIVGNGKVSIEYNVLEVLEDNKFIIEVV